MSDLEKKRLDLAIACMGATSHWTTLQEVEIVETLRHAGGRWQRATRLQAILVLWDLEVDREQPGAAALRKKIAAYAMSESV